MKALIVDDHPLFRAGLAALLRARAGATILEAGDEASGLALAASHHDLDIIMLDLRLPDGGGGPPAIPRFCNASPATPVIVLSASEDPSDARQSLAAGALGYIPKSASPETLLAAVRFVLDGNIYVPPLAVANESAAAAVGERRNAEHLTSRQIEVLRILAGGNSNKAVARALGVSDKTVKAHLSTIFSLLRVSNRTEAALAARELGLI